MHAIAAAGESEYRDCQVTSEAVVEREPRRIRFAAHVPRLTSKRDWREVARTVEDLGYDALLLGDHARDFAGPFSTLGAVAAATTDLFIGTYVLNASLHLPEVVVREVASLAALSDNRFLLGVGAGWDLEDWRANGVEFESPMVRLTRLTALIRRVKAEPAANHDAGVASVPLLIGGGGDRLLRLASTVADTISIAPTSGSDGSGLRHQDSSLKSVLRKVASIRVDAAVAGRVPELSTVLLGSRITSDRVGALAETSKRIGVPVEELAASPHVLFGSVDEVVDTVLGFREELGLTLWVVNNWREFAPVVSRLGGR